ncbi:MAG: hypothetical protein PVSMB7_19380 [Chloroflexota bacterium]
MKLILIVGTLACAALSSLTPVLAAPMTNTIHQQKTVGAYRIILQVGPAEAMSNHPKGSSGERMLGGKMASCSMTGGGMGGMSMGSRTCNRHIEVHVDNRHTGKVVRNARVLILLSNQHMHTMIAVPIMAMVGATQTMSDLHYGNNVYATRGAYTVSVRVNNTPASFGINLT